MNFQTDETNSRYLLSIYLIWKQNYDSLLKKLNSTQIFVAYFDIVC